MLGCFDGNCVVASVRLQLCSCLVGFNNEYITIATIAEKSFFLQSVELFYRNTQHRKNVLHKNGRIDAPVKKLTI